jgi:thiamine biosynthesis lipoprotein
MKTNNQRLAPIMTILLVTTLLITVSFTGCSGVKKVTKTRFMMDTIVDLTVYGTSKKTAEPLIEEVFVEMQRLESIFDKNNPESDISRINDAAGRDWVEVEPETIFVLQQALEMAQKTGGAYDPTVGPLMELWGFGTELAAVPPQEEIDVVLPFVDYTAIQLDTAAGKVFLPQRGMRLDFGGIAKGFIVDQGQKILDRFPVGGSYISAGGDLKVSGNKPSGEKWRIAIQDPRDPQEWAAIIPLQGGSVATSGDYQRSFKENGEVFHHILDPHQGMPATGLRSATVVAPDAMAADALATAVFVLGKKEGLKLLESLDGIEGVVIDLGGEIHASSGLVSKIEIPSS